MVEALFLFRRSGSSSLSRASSGIGVWQVLCAATFRDWRWMLQRVFVLLLFFFWMCSLAQHYCVPAVHVSSGGLVCRELYLLLVFASCMMSISVSRRFHVAVRLIWNSPFRPIYLKLFVLYACLLYLVGLRVLDPSLWKVLAPDRQMMTDIYQLHVVLHRSQPIQLILPLISVSFLTLTSGVIFLFWKTSFSVPTVSDADGDPVYETRSDCGLCQLGLCLNNVHR